MSRRVHSTTSAEDFLPEQRTLAALRAAAASCRGCDLWRRATQTVFGEGGREARVMLLGEQPGHEEDQDGHPFVGPAGRLLDRALQAAGIARGDAYVTNVVKHFRWEGTRGTRRLHRKPSMAHITACRPWLDAELHVVKPGIVVCLGATAAQAIIGRAFKLTARRGEILEVDGIDPLVTATVHPSSILRADDDAARRAQREAFVRDLAAARRALGG
jgi:DNA polymerase